MTASVDVLGNLASMAMAHGEKWEQIHDAVAELIANRDALRDALIKAEARLSILIENDRHKLLDVMARDDARIALARTGGAA